MTEENDKDERSDEAEEDDDSRKNILGHRADATGNGASG